MLLILEEIGGWKHQKNDKSGGMLNRYKRVVDSLLEFIEFYYKSLFFVHIRFKVRPKLAVRRQRVIHSHFTILKGCFRAASKYNVMSTNNVGRN